jgi:nicotinamidase-related amidase
VPRAAANRSDSVRCALIVIDMINAFDFSGGEALLRAALPASARIARLKHRAKAHRVPVIYANDNYGQWRSDFRQVIAACSDPDSRGAELVQALHPDTDDYFVLKPMHSAFHATPLQFLLEALAVNTLILTGIATDNCVLATALDAHTRHYQVFVPADCTAAETAARRNRALLLLSQTASADIRHSARITRQQLAG